MPRHPESETAPIPGALLAQSTGAFYRDLPELLKKHDGMWIAYHGDRCVGIARTETDLYQDCLRQGLPEAEFIVLYADRQALHDREEVDLPPNR